MSVLRPVIFVSKILLIIGLAFLIHGLFLQLRSSSFLFFSTLARFKAKLFGFEPPNLCFVHFFNYRIETEFSARNSPPHGSGDHSYLTSFISYDDYKIKQKRQENLYIYFPRLVKRFR